MTKEDLEKGIKLQADIESTETILNNTKSQKTEWIAFTFGNGSNRSTVCKDKDTIEQIRQLLIVKHTQKLTYLKEELKRL